MIRAKMNGRHPILGKRQVMLLGLSDANIERLKAGQPIMHNMEDSGFPGIDVIIFHGADEEELKQDLKIISKGKL